MKLCFIPVVLGLLNGCAAPVVYLQPGDSPELAEDVIQRLETKGLDVQLLESPLPYNIAAAELLIHPLLTGGDLLELVKDSLREEGLADIQVKDFSQSNHFYSSGHLGIYLPREQISLPVVMQTRECGDIRATLERLSDTRVVLEVVAEPEDMLVEGTYVMKGGQGTVTLNHVNYDFTLTAIEVDTFFGLRPADVIRLESNKQNPQAFDQCEFITVYGG